MKQDINTLCKYPLFQLNLTIWLTQPQSPDEVCVDPIFYKSVLNINSVSPSLSLPPKVRNTVSGKLDCQDVASPDLVLTDMQSNLFCLFECKASSFGIQSTAARQARTLLLMAGPIISDVLGLGVNKQNCGVLCYLTGPDQMNMLRDTLITVKNEIENTGLKAGPFGCIEIHSSRSVIVLEYQQEVKDLMHLIVDSPATILKLEEGTDPRPLYIIPYDPNIDQTDEEKRFCKRILFERTLGFLISTVGGADIPLEINFGFQQLLNAATFNFCEVWENNNAKKNLRRLVKNFLTDIKNSLPVAMQECINHVPRGEWVINIKDDETKSEFLKQLQKFKPATLDLSEEVQPFLFESDNDD